MNSIEEKAWNFAKKCHAGQVRKFSGNSYFDEHVVGVFNILKSYVPDDPELGSSALLHDTIEDCFPTESEGYDEISNQFGTSIADIVMELTSDGLKIKEMGKAKYLSTKMINMSDKALIVKLCDRKHNISDAFTANPKFRERYYFETKEICKSLRENRKLTSIQNKILSDIESSLKDINTKFKIDSSISNFKDFTI